MREELNLDIPHDLIDGLHEFRNTRNKVAHGRGESTKDEVKKQIKFVEKLEEHLKSIEPPEANDEPEDEN